MFSRARGVNCKQQQLLTLKPGMYHYQAIRIRTHRGESIWSLFRSYINKLNDDNLFNRYDMLSSVYTHEVVEGGIIGCQTTVDQYRRYLTISMVLDRVGRGKYKKLKNIPENLSVFKLKKHVYGSTWQTWFIPIEDI